ncbi:hypothetical protein [Streptomyces nodosus]|uniref:hypothetical protein n=1 Tax=Streptomyces nodosus TaxID=40318 RepID=UPI0037F65292
MPELAAQLGELLLLVAGQTRAFAGVHAVLVGQGADGLRGWFERCGTTAPTTVPGRRSAAHLLNAAHTRHAERRQRAEQERTAARNQHPTALAGEAGHIWQQVEAHIATKKTNAYDQAIPSSRNCATRTFTPDGARTCLIHRLDHYGLR